MDVSEPQDTQIAEDIQIDDDKVVQEDPVETIPAENEPLPNKLHIRGVDDLSTNELKSYLDQHIKPGYSFSKKEEYKHLFYRLEWINDSELNVNFVSEDPTLAQLGAAEAIKHLAFHVAEEGELAPLDPLQERRCWDLLRVTDGKSAGKQVLKSDIAMQYAITSGLQQPLEETGEEKPTVSDPVTLFVRYATPSDRKIANSKEQSRYYLIHGEPGEFERQFRPKREHIGRRSRYYEDHQPDVVTGEVRPARPAKDTYRERDNRPRYRDAREANGLDHLRNDYRGGYSREYDDYSREYGESRRDVRAPRQRNRNRNRKPREQPRAEEGDLFPDLLARKQAAASAVERDHSPSRMEE